MGYDAGMKVWGNGLRYRMGVGVWVPGLRDEVGGQGLGHGVVGWITR